MIRAKKQSFGKTFIHLFFIIFTFLWCYPFIWMLFSSFKTESEMLMNGAKIFPKDPTFENILRAWHYAKFEIYFFNTVFVTVCDVIIVVVVTSLAGYGLGRGKMPGRKVVLGAITVTMFIPRSILVLPLFHIVSSLGLNNSLAGVIVAQTGPAHVFHILLFYSFFKTVPDEMEESARIEGATYIQTFIKIMLPLARPVIATVIIFNFIAAWNDFMIPLIFTLNKPELRTLGVGMYAFFGHDTIDKTGLAAASVITIIPIIAVFLSLQKYFISGLEGAVKG